MIDNILRITFKHERRIESRPLYQYDYGQVLKFIDLQLPYSYEVHFSNYEHGTSVTQIGNADGVAIPDVLLTTGLPIWAWLYLHTGANDGGTEYVVKIPVYKRASISNSPPTPVQQDVITQTLAALASGVAVATASASNAMDAATEATRQRGATRAYMETTQEYRDAAIAATSHYPKIEDDYWYVWDTITEQFINTDVPARGPKGEPFTYDDFTPEQLEALTGPQGVTFTPSVSSDGVIYWENDGGKENPQSVNIMGASGFSPVIAVSSIVGGHQVSITDASGTQSFDVMDGVGDVQSVNNKTGAVVLTAEDVGALPSDTEVGDPQNVWFGTCDTSSSGTYKYIRISGDKRFVYKEGRILVVYFTNSNTIADIKLAIYYSETAFLTYPVYSGNNNNWRDRETVIFICRNGYFYMVENGEASTTYYGITKLSNSINSTSTTLAATPYAVKTAYDKGSTAYNQATDALALASNAISQASNAYALAETKVTAEEAAAAAPVQSVNNQTGNITLTAADIGALSSDTALPSKVSDLDNDLGYITIETDPTVPAWAKAANKPSYTASEVGAITASDLDYIVNCTPDSPDYSGTMDKTVAEIYTAAQAHKRIIARVWTGIDTYVDATVTMQWEDGDFDYPSFNAFILDDGNDTLLEAYTGARDDGASVGYGVNSWKLIPSYDSIVNSVNGYTSAVSLGAADVGAIAAPSSASVGQVLMYNNGAWEPMLQEKSLQLPYQLIPLSFDGTNVSTTITPQNISEGYTLDGVDYPPYLRSSFTKADLLGSTILLTPIYGNTDGYEFQSGIFDLTSVGFTGLNGLLHIETYNGHFTPYKCTLVTWPASYPTPADIGAISAPSSPSSGDLLTYNGSAWQATGANDVLDGTSAIVYTLTTNDNEHFHVDAEFSDIFVAHQSGRKVLFIAVSDGQIANFSICGSDAVNQDIVLFLAWGQYTNCLLTLSPASGGGMSGSLVNIDTGYGKIDEPSSASAGDVLGYDGNHWTSVTPSAAMVGAIAAPSSPSVGDFLVYTSNGWDAMTLSTWQGGNY